MKFLSIIFFISLISFSLNAMQATTFDLKSGQSVQTGSNVKVKITVTASGTAPGSETFKSGTFTLQNTANATETATLTCSLTTEVTSTLASNGAGSTVEAECTVASLTTAGTYKLSAVTAAKQDASNDCTAPEVKTTDGNTLTVTAPAPGGSDSNAKFLTAFYSLIALILFL